MNEPLYDAHCHLQDYRLREFLPRLFADLSRLGVRKLVVNGTREADWAGALDLADQHDDVVLSLGLHPWFVKERTDNWFASFSSLVRSNNCHIGEIGLDRWIEGYDLAAQEEVFVQQLALAAELDRAVSLHCLRAWGRLLEILSAEKVPARGFLLHSYGGPAEMVKKFVDLGAFFSISGYFAQPRKSRQLEVFATVPRDRLLIETDAPDMPLPDEFREFTLSGDLNHPANLRAIYRFVADFLRWPIEEMAGLVENNFQRLFRLA